MLIANAAWKDHRTRTRGGIVEMKRGEVLGGLEFLANTWGWSVKRVRTFLGELAADGMIERRQSKGQYAAVITICNYDKYQTPAENEASERASERQARGKREASEGQDSTRDTKDTSKDNTTTVEQEAAREPDRPADELKSAFNGQTDSMLSEVAGAMMGDRNAARTWLKNLLQTYDQPSVAEAFHMMQTARSEGQTILMPLRWWSKTASTLKAKNAEKAKPPTKEKPKIEYLDADWIREARAAMDY